MLLTLDYIKENSIFTKNAVNSTLETHIKAAERMHIRPVLGVALYNDLTAKYLDRDNTPLTPEYEALLTLVQPALVEWLAYVAIPFQMAKLANIGAVTRTSEESESPAIETMKWLQSNKRMVADALTQDLVDYLVANAADYPLFQTKNECKTGTGAPNRRRLRFS